MVILDAQRPVDPKEFRTIQNAKSIDSALPTTNIIIDNELDTNSSFRRALYELLKNKRMSELGESFLDTYEALLKSKPDDGRQHCPFDDCLDKNKIYKRGLDEYQCDCLFQRSLFSTDALKIHKSA